MLNNFRHWDKNQTSSSKQNDPLIDSEEISIIGYARRSGSASAPQLEIRTTQGAGLDWPEKALPAIQIFLGRALQEAVMSVFSPNFVGRRSLFVGESGTNCTEPVLAVLWQKIENPYIFGGIEVLEMENFTSRFW